MAEVGKILSEDVRAKAESLPVKPAAVTLTGKYVKLVPIDLQRDNEALFSVSNGSACSLNNEASLPTNEASLHTSEASLRSSEASLCTSEAHSSARQIGDYDSDEKIWRYMSAGPFPTSCKLGAFLFAQEKAENGLCFCVFDLARNKQVGVVNYMNNFPAHLKIELGNIWYSPLVQGTHANLEATYLLLQHAFELGYRRVEWKCDALNLRSRQAAEKMGFKFEGIQESHFIIKGRNRDTAWFRMLDTEWPEVRKKLEVKLEIKFETPGITLKTVGDGKAGSENRK